MSTMRIDVDGATQTDIDLGKKKKIEDEESRDDHMKELLSYIR